MKSSTVFFALILLSATIFCQPKLLKDINIGTSASLVNVDNAVTRVGAFVFFAHGAVFYLNKITEKKSLFSPK